MSRLLRSPASHDTFSSDVRARAKRGHRMRRRHFFSLVGAAAVRPAAGSAQQRKAPTMGVMVVGAAGWEELWRLFREDMRELGYIEGQSIRYEFRSDQGQTSRLPELAAELVRLNVDLIVTWYTPPAQAAKRATREIPIVMAFAVNPVEPGLVESLDRPGGNIPGLPGDPAGGSSKTRARITAFLPPAPPLLLLTHAPPPL